MNAQQLQQAQRIGKPVNDVGGRFMLDGATYAKGAELGFSGFDFYAAGRGGVLGAVPADVVVAAFNFLGPDTVRSAWNEGLLVMPPEQAAAHFLECGREWGRHNLPPELPAGRLTELARIVTDAVTPYGQPLFAAWNAMPWPSDDRGAALQAINLLRELRGGAHIMSVRAAGIDPHAAVIASAGPTVAEFLGWTAPHPDPDPIRDSLKEAESATNLQMAQAFAALDSDLIDELGELVEQAAVTS